MNQLLGPLLEMRLPDVIDILLVTALVYTGAVWIRRTQAALVAAGMLILAAMYAVARVLGFQLTAWIFQGFFAIFLVIVVVIFQEELRQLFERVAVWGLRRDRQPLAVPETLDVLVRCLTDFARARIGALIVIPGTQPIARHVHGGIELGGRLSVPLVKSLFEPHSPGHDGAVIVEGDRVTRFAVHLPLSTDFRQLTGMGTRHSAALGLAERTDALCLVASEERGEVSVAEHGRLRRLPEPAEVAEVLRRRLVTPPRPRNAHWVWNEVVRKNWIEKLASFAVVVSLWYAFVPGARPAMGTYPVKVEIGNLPEGYALENVIPPEVWVTLAGPARAFYFLDGGELRVTVDAALAIVGRRTFQVAERDVSHPRDVSFERVDPAYVKISVRQGAPGPQAREGR